MPTDQDALVSEIQQLRKVSRRWRAIAIAALMLVILVMLPFTAAVFQIADHFHWNEPGPKLRVGKMIDARAPPLQRKGD